MLPGGHESAPFFEILTRMPDPAHQQISTLLTRAEQGDPAAASELLPQVYDALHTLAQRSMAREPAGHTLQPTALINEAYLRLVGTEDKGWNSKGHFYAAAAEAMRRILVERARRYSRIKHGGGRQRVPLGDVSPPEESEALDVLALNDALDALSAHDPRATEIVMLRYFAGLTVEQTAAAMQISERTIRREWAHAKLWLLDRIRTDPSHSNTS